MEINGYEITEECPIEVLPELPVNYYGEPFYPPNMDLPNAEYDGEGLIVQCFNCENELYPVTCARYN